jgi:membrane protein insertase Oxa1/YidC/SpoIIIJ
MIQMIYSTELSSSLLIFLALPSVLANSRLLDEAQFLENLCIQRLDQAPEGTRRTTSHLPIFLGFVHTVQAVIRPYGAGAVDQLYRTMAFMLLPVPVSYFILRSLP